VDGEGNVYVSDGYNFRVQKFDAEGNFLMQFGAQGSGEGQFDEPAAGPIYVDSQGNIYVSTFPRVQKFDAEGNFVAAYGTAGDGDGQFNGAALGTVDSEGNMYIADLLSARVQKLDADGNFLLQWGSQIFDSDGNFLDFWGETGDDNPPLEGEISALAIDGQDNIYVADGANSSIYLFHPR
jgi:tripartite motif-containing protein 71